MYAITYLKDKITIKIQIINAKQNINKQIWVIENITMGQTNMGY